MRLPSSIRTFLKRREMLRFYRGFVSAGDLCFDIGANVGERADVFLKLGGTVVAVEPQQSCVRVLADKYARQNRLSLVHCALGEEAGESELRICTESTECATLSPDFVAAYSEISGLHWDKIEQVKVRTLADLCAEFGMPAFCKIDVEGYESAVFRGMGEPLACLSFEFNQALLADTAQSLLILQEKAAYRCNFIQYEQMRLVLPKWLPIGEFRERLYELIPAPMLTGEIFVQRV